MCFGSFFLLRCVKHFFSLFFSVDYCWWCQGGRKNKEAFCCLIFLDSTRALVGEERSLLFLYVFFFHVLAIEDGPGSIYMYVYASRSQLKRPVRSGCWYYGRWFFFFFDWLNSNRTTNGHDAVPFVFSIGNNRPQVLLHRVGITERNLSFSPPPPRPILISAGNGWKYVRPSCRLTIHRSIEDHLWFCLVSPSGCSMKVSASRLFFYSIFSGGPSSWDRWTWSREVTLKLKRERIGAQSLHDTYPCCKRGGGWSWNADLIIPSYPCWGCSWYKKKHASVMHAHLSAKMDEKGELRVASLPRLWSCCTDRRIGYYRGDGWTACESVCVRGGGSAHALSILWFFLGHRQRQTGAYQVTLFLSASWAVLRRC